MTSVQSVTLKTPEQQPDIDPANNVYKRAYFEITEVLDEALGTEEKDDAGAGIVADVMLLAQRYKDLRTAILSLKLTKERWVEVIAEIERAPLRCSHGIDIDEDCPGCSADVMAQIANQKAAEAEQGGVRG